MKFGIRAKNWRIAVRVLSALMGCSLAFMGTVQSAKAQAIPTPAQQEVLVKTTLLTFNDANVTGNYTVLQLKLSKPFRDQFSPDKLKETFKEFSEKHIDIDLIVAKPLVPSSETLIDDNGVLRINGLFETTPKKVKYKLGFIRSEGEWKPVGINVDID